MGQCLSQSGKATGKDAAGEHEQRLRVANHLAASRAPGAPLEIARAVLDTHARAKAECKAPDLNAYPSSASDGTSTLLSAMNVTTESSNARASGPAARHLDAVKTLPSEQSLPSAEKQFEEPASRANVPQGSLLPLNSCVRSPASPPAPSCKLRDLRQKRESAGSAGEPEEIVVNQAGCCGPIGRKEINLNKLSFDKEALARGLAGLPHDVVQYGAPRPANEDARMATVRALRNMEVKECPELDLILKVICRVWQAPSACVTLLDSDHVFICSAEGMGPAHRPWSIAMCPWMLLAPHPTAMAIDDLTRDARFSKSLHVAGGTRAYLTAPLVASNGHRLGAICFTDNRPRRFDAGDCRVMNNCAELAVRALEGHLNVSKRLGLLTAGKKGFGGGQSGSRLGSARSSVGSSGEGPRGSRTSPGSRKLKGGLGLKPEEDDGSLMEQYCNNRVRNLAVIDDTVLLLLDTRSPGWTILYVSPSWEELTGTDRLEAMGATLNDVMAHVSGDPRVVWEGVEREAAAGKPFVTPRVYCKAAPAITFYLSFRPAATDDVDEQTLTLGVPASVPQAASNTTARLFFARLHTTPDPPANSRMQSQTASAILTTGRRLAPSIAINPVHGLTEMFSGLTVGQVLGQGSYGTVYHARWHGVDVAIKVQDMHLRSAEERERAEFEVGLGQRLHHINVVRTLVHSSALLERPDGQVGLDSGDSNIWHAGLHIAPIGFLLASARASAAHSSAASAANLAGLDPAPAFIPFYVGGGVADEAAVAAAGVAGSAATATAADTQPSLVDGPPSVAANSTIMYSRAMVSAGGRQPLSAMSESNNAVVRVALPSGVQVPLLRQQSRAVPTSAAALNAALPSLAALLATRGSSRSGGQGGSPMTTLANSSAGARVPHGGGLSPSAAASGTDTPPAQPGLSPPSRAVARSWLHTRKGASPRNGVSESCAMAPGSAAAAVVVVAKGSTAGDVPAASRPADGSCHYGMGGGGGVALVPFFRAGSSSVAAAASPTSEDAAGNGEQTDAGFGSAVQFTTEASALCSASRVVPTAGGAVAAAAEVGSEAGAGATTTQEGGGFNAFPVLPDFGGFLHSTTMLTGHTTAAHVQGGPESTVQGAIEADLSGLTYPLDVRLWMVLEFMDKGSLQDAIDRGWLREDRTADHGPDYSAVLATAVDIAAAVAHLHSHDVVHGDLSAVNVLLQSVQQQQQQQQQQQAPGEDPRSKGNKELDTAGRGFIAKISDFGLSMQLKRPDQAIKTGSYGTITHMAPEVLRDSALSKAGDVYSVGVLLWQMVTGSRPWSGLTHLQVSVEVGTNMRQLQWPSWVHAGVRALGQRCLAPRPQDRPTAAQLHEELQGLQRQVPQYG